MQLKLVSGKGNVTVELPDDTVVVEQSLATPIKPIDDLDHAIADALASPLEGDPLAALATGKKRVTVAFDDPTVPCYAPVWVKAVGAVVDTLVGSGVDLENIELVAANGLHRQFTEAELGGVLGPDLVRTFRGRLGCHDAEDPDGIVDLGPTPSGYPVQLNRRAVDCDLLIYVNTACWRAFNGGWKSICVGLSTFESIRAHHTPEFMSMSSQRNRMHEMLDEMGGRVLEVFDDKPIFKVETVLANPMQVGRIWGGTIAATRQAVLELVRERMPARRDLTRERFDILLYGVPEWSPYAAFATMNPLLRLVSTGLGYLGGPIEAIGAPGCTVILATPCPDEWDEVHHPSYREVWDTVLTESREPSEISARYLDEFAARSDYIDKYRHHFGFHPTHGIMATYPLKRLRHAARVIVAGEGPDHIPARLGFQRTDTVEAALALAREHHGADARVGVVRYPPAFNRA